MPFLPERLFNLCFLALLTKCLGSTIFTLPHGETENMLFPNTWVSRVAFPQLEEHNGLAEEAFTH